MRCAKIPELGKSRFLSFTVIVAAVRSWTGKAPPEGGASPLEDNAAGLFDVDFGVDGVTGAKQFVLVGVLVEVNADRNTLNDLDVVAGGIFRWKQ